MFSLEIKTADDLRAEQIKTQIATLAQRVNAMVEAVAQARGYNGAAHMASYAVSTVPEWAAEAESFVAWRDQVWLYAYSQQAMAEESGIFDETAFLAGMPTVIWPEDVDPLPEETDETD